MRPRLAALGSLKAERASEKQLAEATRDAWDCVVCEHEVRAAADVIERALENALHDAEWRASLTGSELCLAHLRDVVTRSRSRSLELTTQLLQSQVARLRDVDARLAAFQHHHAHDRRAALTDAERRSVGEVRVILAGGDRR